MCVWERDESDLGKSGLGEMYDLRVETFYFILFYYFFKEGTEPSKPDRNLPQGASSSDSDYPGIKTVGSELGIRTKPDRGHA